MSMPKSDQKPKVVIIQGPTGVGKTAVASALAGALSIEVINADSMQFYRYMDIGTSKPTPEEMRAAPHHLFSIVDPDEDFNAARFMESARRLVGEVSGRGNVPVVVGGTGLYIKALTQGLFSAPEQDPVLRDELQALDKTVLWARLQEVDPESAEKLNPNDTVRIVRALEVYHLTGMPLSEHHLKHRFQDSPFDCLKICLTRDREILYTRIGLRVEHMVQEGLFSEVEGLLEKGYSPDLKAMQSIGYRQMAACIAGKVSFERAVELIKQETRRFAKRQFTWLRKDADLVWVKLPEKQDQVVGLVKNFLNNA